MKKSWMLIAAGVALLVVAGTMFASTAGSLASNWAYEMTGLRAAQAQGFDGSGVTVAVVDTGFDPHHSSLDRTKLVAWRDLVGGKPDPYDDVGHGSHVTGILLGRGTSFAGRLQGFDMKGAAPGANLIAVKAIDKDGHGTSANVAAGIDYAVQKRADIICLSLGSHPPSLPNLFSSDDITTAVNNAVNQGVLVVAAAGNTGPSSSDVESPAVIDRVIAVGAVDSTRHVADFSARGDAQKNDGLGGFGVGARSDPHKKPEIVAPGVDIKSAWKDGAYALVKGTSQAAPFTCGALALLLQSKPSLRADNSAGLVDRVKGALKASAEPVAGQRTPHDNAYGYGLLRADVLLTKG